MPPPDVPGPIIELAERRAAARSARDWPVADQLKADIEAAGWRVVDAGSDFTLTPARPPDVVEADRTVYGSVASVPSRSAEPDAPGASVVVLAPIVPGDLSPVLGAIAAHAPPTTSILVLAAADTDLDVDTDQLEVLTTTAGLSSGSALAAALRRATGRVVIVHAPDRLPRGDFVSPLVAALDDADVAIAGQQGLQSADLIHFEPSGPGEVTALGAGCFAFRRADVPTRGAIDERINLPDGVAAWWSLVLRNQGPGATPRRALALDLPLEPVDQVTPPESEGLLRQARRDSYRIADRFKGRADLAAPETGRMLHTSAAASGRDERRLSARSQSSWIGPMTTITAMTPARPATAPIRTKRDRSGTSVTGSGETGPLGARLGRLQKESSRVGTLWHDHEAQPGARDEAADVGRVVDARHREPDETG